MVLQLALLVAIRGRSRVLNFKSNASYRREYPLPAGNIIGEGLGCNIHFTNPAPEEIRRIHEAGMSWVRMDFFWPSIEKKKGDYNFSAYDGLMAHLDKYKIRPIFILDYGNDLYQHGAPTTPEARAAFCRFVKISVLHFKGRGIVWEMWNEPNIGFWQPTPNVQQYIKLALQVGQTIRKIASKEWFVGPGCSTFDFPFLESCFKAGLLKEFDAISVHPYRGDPPETVVNDWMKLHSLIKKYEPAGKHVPMVSSEWGYSTFTHGISEQAQAAFLERMMLTNEGMSEHKQWRIPISIWYDWKNDGPDANNAEHRFGMVHQNLDPKPAYTAITVFIKKYRGWKVTSFMISGTGRDSTASVRLVDPTGKKCRNYLWRVNSFDFPKDVGDAWN